MRVRLLLILVLAAQTLSAKDVYLSVGGSANGFFTDARIVNPSYDKDITITARYLPSGNGDNSGAVAKTITVARRSMAVYDNVVQSLFGGGAPLGAIRLTSDDDFIATQRIYADKRAGHQQGTLGQFVPGLEVSQALKKGIVMQLKAGAAALGNFRTNWGGANPNPVVANISFTLYDKDNAVAGTNTLTVQPFGVIAPTNLLAFFGSPTRDLTDSWFSYESDQPVFVYGSVIDNGSEDPTFITAFADTGVALPPPPPPPPTQKNVVITARDFSFTVTGATDLHAGDEVKFTVSRSDGTHGLRLTAPNGTNLINLSSLPDAPADIVKTLPMAGDYFFTCTNISCGEGHSDMTGMISVTAAGSSAGSTVTIVDAGEHHHH